MPRLTFDTSTITRKLSGMSDNFILSEIVPLELIETVSDNTKLKVIYRHAANLSWRRSAEHSEFPRLADFEKDSVLAEAREKRKNKGKSQAKHLGATKRTALGPLIAVSANRCDVTMITENFDNFNENKYYCDFKLIKGPDFGANNRDFKYVINSPITAKNRQLSGGLILSLRKH